MRIQVWLSSSFNRSTGVKDVAAELEILTPEQAKNYAKSKVRRSRAKRG
jgi:hypothetical protein